MTFFDISERKRAEDHVQAAQSRLQAIVEQIPAAVLIADAASGRLITGNLEAAVLVGGERAGQPVIGDWNAAVCLAHGIPCRRTALRRT